MGEVQPYEKLARIIGAIPKPEARDKVLTSLLETPSISVTLAVVIFGPVCGWHVKRCDCGKCGIPEGLCCLGLLFVDLGRGFRDSGDALIRLADVQRYQKENAN